MERYGNGTAKSVAFFAPIGLSSPFLIAVLKPNVP